MRVLVSGSTGLIGSQLVPMLANRGHTVVRLVRRAPAAGEEEVRWDPATGVLDGQDLQGIDAAVHLAGESITRRWTPARKRRLRDSRIDGTRLLCETLARLDPLPKVLVSMSAVGYYGDRGGEELTEESPPGSGFLAEVGSDWEGATGAAAGCGIRVVLTRLGVVLTPRGGALARMLPAFRLGLGGRLGSGDQFISWISLEDALRGIFFALETGSISGPVNLAAPAPVTNRAFTAALARALRRPALFPVPAVLLELVLGEMARELLLASTRARPRALLESGFTFRHTDIDDTFAALLR